MRGGWAVVYDKKFVFSGIIILSAVTIDCLKYVQKK
jgi:ABC-type glucose/galactose transport system permease subunit